MEITRIKDDEAIEELDPFSLHKAFIKYAFILNIANGLALLIPLFLFFIYSLRNVK